MAVPAQNAPRSVLLVDENPNARASLEMVLVRTGFACSSLADGEAALVSVMQVAYDLIITDLTLPGQSGVEWLRAARVGGVRTPAILLSGHLVAEVPADLAESLGIMHVLAKPVRPQALLMAVRDAVARTPDPAP